MSREPRTEVKPYTARDIDYWRGQLVDRVPVEVDWPDEDVLAVIGRFVATLDLFITDTSRVPLDVDSLERAFVRVIDRRPTKVAVTYFYGDTIPVEIQREAFLRDVAAEYARLVSDTTAQEEPQSSDNSRRSG